MDRRTEILLDAMAHPGAAFVFELLARGPLMEDELLQLVEGTSQATANRRLGHLGELGILERAIGPKQTKGRRWSVVAPDSASAFLLAAMELSRAADRAAEAARSAAESQLGAATETRANLYLVEE
jgi:DNA-binding HxlR family transcriptional regulator